MRNDDRGLTLVELLIAIAISSIIVGAATLLLSSAHKGYSNASSAIDLQSEAQVLMEQIGMWTMEGNRVEVGSDYINIYQIPHISTTTGASAGVTTTSAIRKIWYHDNKLYMKNFPAVNYPTDNPAAPEHLTTDEGNDTLIGEYVTVFSPAAMVQTVSGQQVTVATPGSVVSGCSAVDVSFSMKAGKQDYKLSNEFKLRNKVR